LKVGHTAENIVASSQSGSEENAIEDKVFCIVSYSGSNVMKARYLERIERSSCFD
jgi:hypothetical protein